MKIAKDGPIWRKFGRLAQNDVIDMAITMKRTKSKPEADFQYSGRFPKPKVVNRK